jgi:hypothetical protein
VLGAPWATICRTCDHDRANVLDRVAETVNHGLTLGRWSKNSDDYYDEKAEREKNQRQCRRCAVCDHCYYGNRQRYRLTTHLMDGCHGPYQSVAPHVG